MERGLSRTQIIEELARSPHGKLEEFLPIGVRAAREETEFVAHLVAWNHRNGSVRDAKVALPVISLMNVPVAIAKDSKIEDDEIAQNALAHLAALDPRNFVRALDFSRVAATPGRARALRRLVELKLRDLERDPGRWDRTALQHRKSMKTLYARFHVKPGARAEAVLFKGDYPKGSIFEVVKGLKMLPPLEAAGAIVSRKIPFLIAVGAMGAKMKETDVVLALISRMSPSELVTNTKMLQRLGVKTNPALRSAFEIALGKSAGSSANILKTSVAADAVEDESLREKLIGLQEKQIRKAEGIEGDWLVLGDASPSMQPAIDATRHLAGTLAKFVKGKVHLVFFDGGLKKYVDATGMDYDKILAETKRVDAGGSSTSIGAGVRFAMDKGFNVDGIAIVSDGGENAAPVFPVIYKELCTRLAKSPPVYLFLLPGSSSDVLTPNMREMGLEMTTFDYRRTKFDFYSLPNVVQKMRVQRHGLVEEIMETRLLKLADVF